MTTLPNFNPSKDARVDRVKDLTEQIFALLKADFPDNRQRSKALSDYEQACMWAVKSLFV